MSTEQDVRGAWLIGAEAPGVAEDLDALQRLLTEEEWEYACRAGTATQWSHGDDEARLGEYA